MAGDQHQFAPVVGQRVVEREPRDPATPGSRFSRSSSCAVHRRQLRQGVARRRPVESHDDATAHAEAEILVFELAQAARQHRRAGDEDDRQRRLDDQQRGARERRVIAGAATGAAQRFDRIGARRQPRGHGAENDAGNQRQRRTRMRARAAMAAC